MTNKDNIDPNNLIELNLDKGLEEKILNAENILLFPLDASKEPYSAVKEPLKIDSLFFDFYSLIQNKTFLSFLKEFKDVEGCSLCLSQKISSEESKQGNFFNNYIYNAKLLFEQTQARFNLYFAGLENKVSGKELVAFTFVPDENKNQSPFVIKGFEALPNDVKFLFSQNLADDSWTGQFNLEALSKSQVNVFADQVAKSFTANIPVAPELDSAVKKQEELVDRSQILGSGSQTIVYKKQELKISSRLEQELKKYSGIGYVVLQDLNGVLDFKYSAALPFKGKKSALEEFKEFNSEFSKSVINLMTEYPDEPLLIYADARDEENSSAIKELFSRIYLRSKTYSEKIKKEKNDLKIADNINLFALIYSDRLGFRTHMFDPKKAKEKRSKLKYVVVPVPQASDKEADVVTKKRLNPDELSIVDASAIVPENLPELFLPGDDVFGETAENSTPLETVEEVDAVEEFENKTPLYRKIGGLFGKLVVFPFKFATYSLLTLTLAALIRSGLDRTGLDKDLNSFVRKSFLAVKNYEVQSAELEKWQSKYIRLVSENETLETKLHKQNSENKAEQNAKQNQNHEQNNKTAELTKRLKAQVEQANNELSKLKQDYDNKRSEYEKRISDLTKTVEKLKKDYQDLDENYKRVLKEKENKTKSKEELNKYNEEKKKYETQIKKYEKQITNLSSEKSNLEKKIASLDEKRKQQLVELKNDMIKYFDYTNYFPSKVSELVDDFSKAVEKTSPDLDPFVKFKSVYQLVYAYSLKEAVDNVFQVKGTVNKKVFKEVLEKFKANNYDAGKTVDDLIEEFQK